MYKCHKCYFSEVCYILSQFCGTFHYANCTTTLTYHPSTLLQHASSSVLLRFHRHSLTWPSPNLHHKTVSSPLTPSLHYHFYNLTSPQHHFYNENCNITSSPHLNHHQYTITSTTTNPPSIQTHHYLTPLHHHISSTSPFHHLYNKTPSTPVFQHHYTSNTTSTLLLHQHCSSSTTNTPSLHCHHHCTVTSLLPPADAARL